jgi:ABC-2 type transport system permease protein
LACYLNSEEEIDGIFKSGIAKQVIVFEQGFSSRLAREGTADVQLINDASNPNMATMMNSYSSAIIRDYLSQKSGGAMLVTPEVKMLYNPELKSSNFFVPGLVTMILMLISALMTSITMTREKETGSMEILLVSPLSPFVIVLGKVIPYIALAAINGLSVLIIAILAFDMPFVGSVALFTLLTFIYIITALTLGLLISTVTDTQQVAMLISLVGLLLPTMLLSGFIYPVENMPTWLQYLTHVFPATYYLSAIKGVMLKGAGLEYVWRELSVLCGMIVFLVFVSVKKFKIRLE